ncbi:MAG TPA: nucleotidyltransferase family protein [Chloroflexia bacterium]|nr:nucleotidyltransferase family protein [Chloroflexia bacterium]
MSAWGEAGIAAVVLAAGRSARMGAGSKLLLPHPTDGLPLLHHAVAGVLALEPSEIIVVIRTDLPQLTTALAGLPVRLVPNVEYAAGMSTSLRAGIASLLPAVQAALVVLGDTPAVPPAVFSALLAAYQRDSRPITLPVYGDVPGPPTLFARTAFAAIATLTGDQGARPLAAVHPTWVTRVPLPADWQPADIDTPADYDAFRAMGDA